MVKCSSGPIDAMDVDVPTMVLSPVSVAVTVKSPTVPNSHREHMKPVSPPEPVVKVWAAGSVAAPSVLVSATFPV